MALHARWSSTAQADNRATDVAIVDQAQLATLYDRWNAGDRSEKASMMSKLPLSVSTQLCDYIALQSRKDTTQ